MRTRKVVRENGREETTDYTLHGKLITHLTKRRVENEEETVDNLHFFYDAQSKPAFVEYEGQMYRYIHNLQGDIVGILDSAGNTVVEYKYDAWGRSIVEIDSMVSGLAEINPFRYRGYIKDEEGYYYLATRYYDASISRFINIDTAIITNWFIGSNAFCYCNNHPVKLKDTYGAQPTDAEIHRSVQNAILLAESGTAMFLEVPVYNSTTGVSGRIDLFRITTGEAWEVKKCTISMEAAIEQLNGYLDSEFSGSYSSLNDTIAIVRGGPIVSGVTTVGDYSVPYWYADEGIILYDVVDPNNGNKARIRKNSRQARIREQNLKSKPSYTDIDLIFYSAAAGGALFFMGVTVIAGIGTVAVSASSSAGAAIIEITKYFLDKAA